MGLQDARIHLDAAIRALCLECWSGPSPDQLTPQDDFTIAEELERIDRALGPKGQSMFFAMADNIREAYTEIKAARAALGEA